MSFFSGFYHYVMLYNLICTKLIIELIIVFAEKCKNALQVIILTHLNLIVRAL